MVDVRPTTGDVLFRTSVVDQVEWLGAWLPGGYSKVERTATWDYLQAFIDAGKSPLRIHAAINTFTGGNQTLLGGAGVVFRDEAKRAWTTDLNLAGGITNIMSTSRSAKFFNPVLPEVQEYLCSMLRDLAAYDGLAGIFLDRGRFDGFTSDFSNYTRKEFEKYIGQSVAGFPADILPAGHTSGIPSPVPVHMKQWLEFRAEGDPRLYGEGARRHQVGQSVGQVRRIRRGLVCQLLRRGCQLGQPQLRYLVQILVGYQEIYELRLCRP